MALVEADDSDPASVETSSVGLSKRFHADPHMLLRRQLSRRIVYLASKGALGLCGYSPKKVPQTGQNFQTLKSVPNTYDAALVVRYTALLMTCAAVRRQWRVELARSRNRRHTMGSGRVDLIHSTLVQGCA